MDGGPTDGAAFDAGPGDVANRGDASDANRSDDSGVDVNDADAGVAREPLCDGVAHLRLWALIAPGDELRGSLVRVENGYPFLAIDGTCSYWIGGGWEEDLLSRDRPLRTGTLAATDAATIEQLVPLGDIAPLRDCPPPPANLFDYSFRVLRTATKDASCFTAAPELTAGTRFESAWIPFEAIAARLWNDGTPVNGAIHVSAAPAADGPANAPPYTWPIATPLASFVLADSDVFAIGVSRLVDDPTTASQLRALRDRYLSDRTAQPGLYLNWDGLLATDQSTTANVYMRDAIPYEDARGLLGF